MTLTTQQLQCLYVYCSTIGIDEFDVQTELVDHFTEWIEQRWKDLPDKKFSDIFYMMKESFPEEDLIMIAREKRKAVEKELWNLYKKEFLSFFNVPKISLSVLLFLIFFLYPWSDEMSILTFINPPLQLSVLYMLLYSAIAGKNIIRKNTDDLKQPLLIHQKLSLLQWKAIGGFIAFFLILLFIGFFKEIKLRNDLISTLLKVIIPMYMISTFSITHVFVRVNTLIRNRYPLAFK